jgi:mono/diheme cytochrome c family protein
MKTLRLITLLSFALVVPTLAQTQNAPPDAARGQDLARRWCAACHLVKLRLTTIDPPTFSAIADDPRKTPDSLRNFLAGPHKDMPPIQLTPSQIEDLIAYLASLRGQ